MAEGKTISRLEAAGALTLAALASPAVAQDAIRIGSFLAVTGPAAFLGEPEKKTLELYVDRINGEGGVLGQPLELVVYDTGMNAKDAVTFAKRLIEQDEVDAIIGGTTTGETMAVVKLMEEAGIPFISLAGASVIVDPVQKWVFKTPHTDRMAVDKVYEDMRKEGVAAIGLIGGAGGFDKSCLANAQELADEHGLEIKANETYGASDTDMTPQLTKIKNAGVDAVLFCGFGAASTIVTRTTPSSASSCRSTTITAAARSSSSTVPARRRKACGCPAALLVADQLPEEDPQKPVAKAYAEAYTATTGEEVSTFGGHAYDALLLLSDAIQRAGSTDPSAVRDALEATDQLIGVDGIFTMSPDDHMGLGLESFKMLAVENGDWKYLY
jgi:branched-chain amino acid transport system substrate-binding protein